MQEKIISFLKEEYKPVAIVLSGSRVSGNFSKNSDWDFYIFTNKSLDLKDGLNEYEGETLDISVVDFPVSDDFILDTRYHPEQHLKIIHDESDGQIKDLVDRTLKKYEEGPGDIEKQEYQRLKKVMRRYINKSDDRREIKGLSSYYLGIFYEIALRLWFQIKNEWPLPPYEALPHIQNNDPDFYKNLSILFESKDLNQKIITSNEIFDRLFKR